MSKLSQSRKGRLGSPNARKQSSYGRPRRISHLLKALRTNFKRRKDDGTLRAYRAIGKFKLSQLDRPTMIDIAEASAGRLR